MIIVFARTKALNKKFNFKHYLLFILTLLIMYQIIPVSFDLAAMKHSNDENFSKAIKLENLAIKSAIIPYQKGAYYIKMAYFYKSAACYTQMMKAYKNAYNYIKTYKYNWWKLAIANSYGTGYYDETIAMLVDNYPLNNALISKCYIMKRDFEKALFFINKDLEKKRINKTNQ